MGNTTLHRALPLRQSGADTIAQGWKFNNWPEPKIEERFLPDMVDLTLFLGSTTTKPAETTQKTTQKVTTKDKILALVRENPTTGVSQIVIPSGYNTGGANMFAFTEQGVAMLASILKSPRARAASIMIMRAFVAMRRFLVANAQIFQRLDRLDRKQLENEQNFEKVFAKFEENEPVRQGIFFDSQTYDAYTFVSDRIREAKSRVVLVDNYVDDTVLTMLDKREAGVAATIYTMQISKAFQLDIDKHNSQYPTIEVKVFKNSHDRFLIIDDKVYHFGASIKDLGKKWFAVNLMTEYTADELLRRL